MSAEMLREAAKVLRERAEAATPGPWFTDADGIDGIYTEARVSSTSGDVAHAAVGWHRVGTDHYIATMHPGVGLALADWLDDEAKAAAYHENRVIPFAATVARLILGGES